MDGLILSCGTGGGHNSAGMAVMEELRRRGHGADMMNPYTLKSEALAHRVDNTYIKLVQRAPRAFGLVYGAGNLYRKLPLNSPVQLCNRKLADLMERYLAEKKYDFIIMSHLFPAEIMTILKRRGVKLPKTVFVDTDYTCAPFSEEIDVDAWVVPNDTVLEEFIAHGVPRERLYPYGIPVASAFSKPEAKSAAKARLRLPPDTNYILISGGSMGAGSLETAIEAAKETMTDNERAIVICGSNKALYEKLREKHGHDVILAGHTHDMAGYMHASEAYLTKPGGPSSTEAAVLGIPMIHLPPIPGCETVNAKLFSDLGMSITCRSSLSSMKKALEAIRDPNLRASMLRAQKTHVSPTSASDICALAERLAKPPENAEI